MEINIDVVVAHGEYHSPWALKTKMNSVAAKTTTDIPAPGGSDIGCYSI